MQTTCSHASRCHHCRFLSLFHVDFVLVRYVTRYTNSLLSICNTTYLLNITCTLIATCMILGKLECSIYRTKSGHALSKSQN